MGSPYLNSGESIVLTTNRVSVDSVLYDVMLTTERIFLSDNRNVRFEPRLIPLNAVLSVQGGKTPALDPAITLLFRTGEAGGFQQPLNLIFSQDPNENRKAERDDWVRSLIQLSIRQHEREIVPDTPVMPDETGTTTLRPRVRHGVAPEMVLPLSNVVERQQNPAPVTVIPEDVAGTTEITMPDEGFLQGEAARPPLQPVPEEPEGSLQPERRTPPPMPAVPARVIIPQIIEELLPVRTKPVTGEDREPAAVLDPDALFGAVPPAEASGNEGEDQVPSPVPVAGTLPEPQESVPCSETGAEATTAPFTVATALQEAAETVGTPATGSGEPGTAEPPAPAQAGTEPGSTPEIIQETVSKTPQVPGISASTEDMAERSPGQTIPVPDGMKEPAAGEAPPAQPPIPPAYEVRPFRTTIAYAAVLILLVALATAGVILLLPQGPGQTTSPEMPTTLPAQATTPLPVTVQPTLVSLGTTPPVTPPGASPVTSLPAAAATPAEIWVQVNSTAYYFGSAGNPGMLQPVAGTGDNFYKILRNDQPVQVSVQKQDNSGALLTVAIYRNGTLIASRSVTSPMGAVDLLVDPLTARAPGLTGNDLLPENPTTPAGLETY